MAIEELIQEIKSNAAKEIDDIIKRANEEAEKIIKEARKRAEEKADEIKRDGSKRAEAIKARILAMARRNANKYVIEAKEKIIEECIKEIENYLKKMDKKQYKKFVENAIKDAKKEIKDGYVLITRKEDEEIARKLGMEIKGRTEAIGGVIIRSKDGSKEIDKTFDALLDRKKEEIRIKIAEKLWKH